MTEVVATKEIEMVYKGVRENSRGKKIHCWSPVKNYRSSFTWEKNPTPASVGGVYSFRSSEDEDTVFASKKIPPRYIRRLEDKEQVTKWALEEELVIEHFALKSLNTKAAKVEPLDDVLKNIGQIAGTLNKQEKRAFLTKISERIFQMGM
ncbi:MAG: hypothetical protein JWM44_1178 [Bacilli bacterium]|nr:hypothetical protein [Bacilli bacterium]